MADKQNPAALAGAHRAGGGFQSRDGSHCNTTRALDLQSFPAIVRDMLGEPNARMSTKTALRYGEKGALSIDLTKGVFFDHKTGENGGMLALVVRLGHAKTQGEAAQWLRDQGYLSADHVEKSHGVAVKEAIEALEHETTKRRRKRNTARLIWEIGVRIEGTLAATYLKHRAISESAFTICADLRFVPACPLHPYGRDTTHHPALVARVVDRAGNAVGVHVTYLAPDGKGKAAIPSPRKLIGAGFSGACVRLGKGSRVLVAEGIESAFSGGEALDLCPIAALSAGGMKSWHAFEGVHEVTFAPDQDASGIGKASALACAERLHAQGIKIIGFGVPPGGVNDWNDAARAGLLKEGGNQS